MNEQKDLQTYTMKEVANFLKISTRTVYEYVHNGELKGIKLPSGWRFQEKEILAFLARYQARATRIR